MAQSLNCCKGIAARCRRVLIAALRALLPILPLLPLSASAVGPAAPFAPPRAVPVAVVAPVALAGTAVDADGLPIAPAVVELPTLAGIRRGQSPQALLDGRWYRVGDRLGEAQVLVIEATRVTLLVRPGRQEVLSLLPTPAATTSLPTPAVSTLAKAPETQRKVSTP